MGVTFADCIGAAVGLVVLGATDSRRGRDAAAVTMGWTGARAPVASFLFSTGDVRAGVACRLGALEDGFTVLGVVGPAGARGTWTVVVFVESDGC